MRSLSLGTRLMCSALFAQVRLRRKFSFAQSFPILTRSRYFLLEFSLPCGAYLIQTTQQEQCKSYREQFYKVILRSSAKIYNKHCCWKFRSAKVSFRRNSSWNPSFVSVTSSWKLSISLSLSALSTKIFYETEPAWPSGLGRWSCSPEATVSSHPLCH